MATMNTGSTAMIREHMPVVAKDGSQFGMVDRVEDTNIKLTRDDKGQHHWIPTDWVASIDDKVHLDRTGKQAMKEWSTAPPGNSGQTIIL